MTRVARTPAVAVLALAAGAATGCTPADFDRVEVEMTALSFAPETVTVRVGDTLSWVNRDLVPHTVHSGDAFASGAISAGERFSFVPSAAGEVRYLCAYHPLMRGVLRVVPR